MLETIKQKILEVICGWLNKKLANLKSIDVVIPYVITISQLSTSICNKIEDKEVTKEEIQDLFVEVAEMVKHIIKNKE